MVSLGAQKILGHAMIAVSFRGLIQNFRRASPPFHMRSLSPPPTLRPQADWMAGRLFKLLQNVLLRGVGWGNCDEKHNPSCLLTKKK